MFGILVAGVSDHVIHAHGMPDDYVTSVHPASIGMTRHGARDGRRSQPPTTAPRRLRFPRIARAGFTSAVGSPIWVAANWPAC